MIPNTHPTPKQSLFAMAVMCLAVVAVYFPVRENPGDNMLRGGDFHVLHARRMAFAREQLAERGTIPSWYPREAMGTPFWGNIQNFPLIPTRLIVLALPPEHTYLVGVLLSAVLAAVFTFLFGRSVSLSSPAAAAAGWTFACSGFYASRIPVGELPLFEAYPSLPLLLWLVETNFGGIAAVGRWRVVSVAGLVVASMCIALAGHPQLGFYAFVVAGLYAVCRGWRRWRVAAITLLAMGIGVACAAFALWPTILLIGRSTRALPLARSGTDIPFPAARLGAWLFPWKDGWPEEVLPLNANPFTGYPNNAYFFDTVTYLGWLPLLAAALLIVRRIVLRRKPTFAGLFLTIVGLAAMLTALPPLHTTKGVISFTFLRSPSRQTYITTFALTVGLGIAVDVVWRFLAERAAGKHQERRNPRSIWPAGVIAALLIVHAADLTRHDRRFIRTINMPTEAGTLTETKLRHSVGSGRTAIDLEVFAGFNRRFDDAGFFDSIILARTYRTLMDLANAPPTYNTQNFNASDLPADRLAEAGVTLVVTPRRRTDLPRLMGLGKGDAIGVYTVPDPLPRAMFLPANAVVRVPPEEMHRRRRTRQFNPSSELMLPGGDRAPASRPASRPTSRPTTLPPDVASASYERPSSDEIVVKLRGKPAGGYVRVLESFDPGWRVEINGKPADVVVADDAFLAVPIPAGDSTVRFTYHTPGVGAGAAISIASTVSLAALLLVVHRGPTASNQAPAPPEVEAAHPASAP